MPKYEQMTESAGGAKTALAATDQDTTIDTRSRQYSAEVTFDRRETITPKLRLAQGLSQEVQNSEAAPGQYLLTGFEAENEVIFVPVLLARAREYRDRAVNNGADVLCRSGDAITGVGDPGGDCAACPLAEWTEEADRQGKTYRKAPACAMIYSYVGFSETHGAPVAIDFKRTNLDASKLINTMVKMRGLGNFAIKLTSKIVEGKGARYAVSKVSPATVDAELLAFAREACAQG